MKAKELFITIFVGVLVVVISTYVINSIDKRKEENQLEEGKTPCGCKDKTI